MRRVGVLALQGGFKEHMQAIERLGAEAREVRLPEQLREVEGLIIPGGESTTISKLMTAYGLRADLEHLARTGFPIWGTCAGMILLAREVVDGDPGSLAVMGIRVRRNAFGRQLESFQVDLRVPALGEQPFPAVFIRAPWVEAASPDTEVLAYLNDGTIVAVRQGSCLASSFHPELTGDLRFHRYFLENCCN